MKLEYSLDKFNVFNYNYLFNYIKNNYNLKTNKEAYNLYKKLNNSPALGVYINDALLGLIFDVYLNSKEAKK